MGAEGEGPYELDREVGRGAFAAVYLGRRRSDGLKVAIKRVLRKSERSGVDWTALREVKLLQELHHANIVGLLDVFALPGSINMVMELCPFDLKKVIDNKGVLLSEGHIKTYVKMILQGTKAMHDVWILHRDMKPDNLLVGEDRQVKIADFGLGRVFGEPDSDHSDRVVTLPYRCPELLFGAREYGVGVDVWSVGCIMAELMIRRIFLPGAAEEDQLGKIFYMFGTPTEEQWPKMKALKDFHVFSPKEPVQLKTVFKSYSAAAVDLVEQMMRLNPAQRISAGQALQHPFFETPGTEVGDLPYDVILDKDKDKTKKR